MIKGNLVAIFIAPQIGHPMQAVDQVQGIPGRGLQGDHHFRPAGQELERWDPGEEVTLIEAETIESVNTDLDLDIGLGEARRNLVTRGVPLNQLVGRRFNIGDVSLRGIELCEPCAHLAGMTRKEILPALVHRGGLRAQLLSEGVIRIGDVISGNTSG
jgi:MOSC domain-containing protein YiiM